MRRITTNSGAVPMMGAIEKRMTTRNILGQSGLSMMMKSSSSLSLNSSGSPLHFAFDTEEEEEFSTVESKEASIDLSRSTLSYRTGIISLAEDREYDGSDEEFDEAKPDTKAVRFHDVDSEDCIIERKVPCKKEKGLLDSPLAEQASVMSGFLHADQQDGGLDTWTCTICTKRNPASRAECVTCKRAKGYLSIGAALPFHPPYTSFDGARHFLDYRRIQAYLDAGVDPESPDSDGWTGLHWAVALSRLDLAELYVQHGANVNARRNDGWTPLHVACQVGDEECCLFLVENGADPNAPCVHEGFSPLHIAAKENNQRCVEVLGLAGADLNLESKVSRFAPVHLASLAGSYEAVVSLILVSNDPLRKVHREWKPVDLRAKDSDGWTAFHLATVRGHKRLADLLNSKGAGPSGETKLVTDFLSS